MKLTDLFIPPVVALTLVLPALARASGSFEVPDAPPPTVSLDPDSVGPRDADRGQPQDNWGGRRPDRQSGAGDVGSGYPECPVPALPGIDHFIARQPGSVVVAQSRRGFGETVRRLRAAIQEHGLVLANSFSAQASLARAGASVGASQVLDIYPPTVAPRLMAIDLAAGNELPVRVYVYEDDRARTWVKYHSLQLRLSTYANARLMALGQEVDAQMAEIFAGALE
jgi:uncharacterized protein (DUF302 family)